MEDVHNVLGKRWENGKQRLTTWWEKDGKRMGKGWGKSGNDGKDWKIRKKIGKIIGSLWENDRKMSNYGYSIWLVRMGGITQSKQLHTCQWWDKSRGNVTCLLELKGHKHTGIERNWSNNTDVLRKKQRKLKGNGEKPILQNWNWNKCNHNYRMCRWKGRMEEKHWGISSIQPKPVSSEKKVPKAPPQCDSVVDYISFLPYFHPYLVPQEVFPHSFSISSETRPTRTSILLVVGYICLNQHVWTLLFFQGIIVTASISWNIKAVLLTPGV